MYHPADMRKAGPILIVLIGVLALIINFFPNLTAPDSTSPTGSRPIETKLGLDLSGGLRVEYQAQKVDGKSPTAADMAIIKDIIERRVNTTGVSEPVVVTQGDDRVVVELPGRHQSRRGPPARRPDRPPRLRPARAHRRRPRARSWTWPRRPPLFSGDQVSSASIGQDESGGLTRQLRAQGRRRQPLRRLHRQARRRVLRHHARLDRSSPRRRSTRPSPAGTSRSRRAASAGSRRPRPTTS